MRLCGRARPDLGTRAVLRWWWVGGVLVAVGGFLQQVFTLRFTPFRKGRGRCVAGDIVRATSPPPSRHPLHPHPLPIAIPIPIRITVPVLVPITIPEPRPHPEPHPHGHAHPYPHPLLCKVRC